MPDRRRDVVTVLLEREGRTFADEAGITLANRPAPLYQLLVLATLLSARISANVAVTASRELFAAGWRTPEAMRNSSWHDRIAALARGHYRRSGARTATMLEDGAQLVARKWRGDLRGLRQQADGDVGRLRASLTEFPGIGPVGADIFVREVQGQWDEFGPFVDGKVSAGAKALNLPASASKLGALVPPAEMPRLASALVRVSLDGDVAKEIQTATA
jgi:endonuclease III